MCPSHVFFCFFRQYDGNLLRRELIDCNFTSPSSTPVQNKNTKEIVKETDIDANRCYELEKAKDKIYRTHPFYLDYDNDTSEHDITLGILLIYILLFRN